MTTLISSPQSWRERVLLAVVVTANVVAGCDEGMGRQCVVRTVADAEAALEEGCHVQLIDYQGAEASIVNRNPTSTLLVDHDLTPQLQRLNFEGPGLEARRVPEVILVSPSCSEVGGSAAEVLLDITLVAAAERRDPVECRFKIGPGGHVQIRTTDEALSMARLVGQNSQNSQASSWSGVTLDIDEAVLPTDLLDVSDVTELSLEHLQHFGTKMQRVFVSASIPPALISSYAAWLEEQDFAGVVLSRAPNEEDTIYYNGAQ